MKKLLISLALVVGLSVTAAPIVQSGWTTTSDAATARTALGVSSTAETKNLSVKGKTIFVDWVYGNDSTGTPDLSFLPYKTLSAANAAASPGYTIRISGSNFLSAPVVVKGDLTIAGDGDMTFLTAPNLNSGFALIVTNSNTEIRDLCLKSKANGIGSDSSAICTATNIVLRNLQVSAGVSANTSIGWVNGTAPLHTMQADAINCRLIATNNNAVGVSTSTGSGGLIRLINCDVQGQIDTVGATGVGGRVEVYGGTYLGTEIDGLTVGGGCTLYIVGAYSRSQDRDIFNDGGTLIECGADYLTDGGNVKHCYKTYTGDFYGNGSGLIGMLYSEVGNIPASRLLGNSTGATGVAQAITIGTGLLLSAGTLSASGGFTTPFDTTQFGSASGTTNLIRGMLTTNNVIWAEETNKVALTVIGRNGAVTNLVEHKTVGGTLSGGVKADASLFGPGASFTNGTGAININGTAGNMQILNASAGRPALYAEGGIVVTNLTTGSSIELTNAGAIMTNGSGAGRVASYNSTFMSITNGANGYGLNFAANLFQLWNFSTLFTNSTAANSPTMAWNQKILTISNAAAAQLTTIISNSGAAYFTNGSGNYTKILGGAITTSGDAIIGQSTSGTGVKMTAGGNLAGNRGGGNVTIIEAQLDGASSARLRSAGSSTDPSGLILYDSAGANAAQLSWGGVARMFSASSMGFTNIGWFTNGYVSFATNYFPTVNTAGYTNSGTLPGFGGTNSMQARVTATSGTIEFYTRSGLGGQTICGQGVWTNTLGASALVPFHVGVNQGFVIRSPVGVDIQVYAE